MVKEHPWERFVIKDEDLVCQVGDQVKLVADLDSRYHEMDKLPGPIINTKAAGQIYRVDDRKGAGWDLVRLSGDGPNEIRLLNDDLLDHFEIMK